MDNKKGLYEIAGLTMEVDFLKEDEDVKLLPSFKYFSKKEIKEEPYIKVEVGACGDSRYYKFLKKVKTTNGSVLIYYNNRRFRCLVYSKNLQRRCIIEGNWDYTRCRCELTGSNNKKIQDLKTALLIIYVHASSFKQRLLIHSSTVKCGGKAYCFIGKSGDGKSTQSQLWVKNIPGSYILNDDNPILQICDDGKVMVWGSPWSGKTNFYINDSSEMCAVVSMSHGKTNEISRVWGIKSFQDMMSSSSCFPAKKMFCHRVIKMVMHVIGRYPVYEMSCLPTSDAAILCHDTLSRYKA